MKTWYCVVTTIADDHTSANIVDTIEAESPPISDYRETRRADIYIDWFTEEEAERYVKEARTAW